MTRARSLAVFTLLVAALVGCGDSGSDQAERNSSSAAAVPAGGASPGGAGGRRDDGPALLGDRRAARAGVTTLNGFYADLGRAVDNGVAAADVPVGKTFESAAGDAGLATVCELMSEGARRATVHYVRRSANLADVSWTCETAMGLLLRRSKQRGVLGRSLKPKIVGINAKGNRATATVRLGGKRGSVTSLPLVREQGAWKIAAAPAGGP